MARSLPLADVTQTCAPTVAPALSLGDAEALSAALKALADPTRLRLLSLIAASPDHEACVCNLTEPVALSQPTVSHHLRVLTEAGFLTRTKRGTWAYYAIVPGTLARIGAQLVSP